LEDALSIRQSSFLGGVASQGDMSKEVKGVRELADGSAWYRNGGKRLLDVVLVLLALPIWVPTVLALAVLIRLALGTPVLFRQPRVARDDREFLLLKFRTMLDLVDPRGVPLPDEARMTHLGRWLRAWSLDEMPSMVNVLWGDMSLVGPRPLLPEYLALYSADQRRRHEVRPGLTGWAQVNGRNAVRWADRFAMDVWYVDHLSPSLDLRILLSTIAVVASRHGIAHPGQVTMAPFKGSGEEASERDGTVRRG
jgi:lipopolysaccharide/colanic/teichoic acid biosynthesis glycosyltransferase